MKKMVLLFTLAMATQIVFPKPAHAGVIVNLVPDPQQPFNAYESGAMVRVDVYAQLDANSPASIGVREFQFGLSASDAALMISPALTHTDTKSHGDIRFWDFSSAPRCANDPVACGDFYFIDDTIAPPDHAVAIVYTGLTDSPTRLLTLTQQSPVRVGVLDVTLPSAPGIFRLDVLNADEQDFRNFGGFFRYGFDTIVDWSAYQGQITGGQLAFFVGVPEPTTLVLLLMATACLATKHKSK